MTELETMQRAKMYMDKLAQGIDPITNQEVPEDSVLNHVRLARCFFYVSDVLGQVIANGGVIGAKPNLPFCISMEQLVKVKTVAEPIRITQLVAMINGVINHPQMKKLSATVITDWLLEKGFLEKITGPNGENRRIPTQRGLMIGLSTQLRQGKYSEYQAVFYNTDAQQFVLDNLLSMLE